MSLRLLSSVAAAALIAACAARLAQSTPRNPASAVAAPMAAFGNGTHSTGWIDFELNDDHVFLPVTINGHDAIAWLTLGGTSVVDTAFAASIGLKPDAATEVKIGGLTVQSVDIRAQDLSPFVEGLAHPLVLRLSDDLLQSVAVDIDFPHHRLAFRDPKTFAPPRGARALKLAHLGVGYSVPASVEGAVPGLFHIEFGNASPLMVTRPYADTLKLLQDRRHSQRYTGPNKEPEDMTTLSQVTFAGTHFTNMPTVVVPNSLFDPGWFDADHLSGIVGAPLLVRYRLIFDFPDNRLYTVSAGQEATQPFGKDRLGVNSTDGVVTFVAPGSPAQAAGFKQGEKIRLIDNRPPQNWTRPEILALRFGPAGSVATFTMDDGETRRVTLAEYY